MHIHVISKCIEYKPILDYYNARKSDDEEPLEILDRFEGGFQIQITHMKNEMVDNNLKIRQLRWNRGELKSFGYIGFSEKQVMLLYEAIVNAFPGQVLLIE